MNVDIYWKVENIESNFKCTTKATGGWNYSGLQAIFPMARDMGNS